MIRHVVLWKLNDPARAPEFKAALEALPGQIASIRSFEVGIGASRGEMLADIALVSTFETESDLQAYLAHPDHQQVVELARTLAVERRVIDYSG